MKSMLKVAALAVIGLFAMQSVNAQTVQLGNEDFCPTTFVLTWVLGGTTVTTTHVIGTTGNFPVAPPAPGFTITTATVTRTGGGPVVVTIPPYPAPSVTGGSNCCGPYALPRICDNIVETQWGSTPALLGIAAH